MSSVATFDWGAFLDSPDDYEAPWFFKESGDDGVWLSALWASAVALAEVLAFVLAPLPAGGLQAMVVSAIAARAEAVPPDASASDDARIAVNAALATYARLLEMS